MERVVLAGELPGVGQRACRVEVRGRLGEQLLEVPAALEVDEREAERSLGDPPDDVDHVVTDAEPRRVVLDAGRDLGRDRDEQHLGQQHHLDHPGTERLVAVAQADRERLGADGFDLPDVERDAGHRLHVRVEHGDLHDRQPARRRHRAHDARRGERDLVGRRPRHAALRTGAPAGERA